MKLASRNLLPFAARSFVVSSPTARWALLPSLKAKLLALSAMVMLTGGALLLAPPAFADEAMPACDAMQVREVKERIKRKCGVWGGRARVVCRGAEDNWEIEYLWIHCWEDGFYPPKT